MGLLVWGMQAIATLFPIFGLFPVFCLSGSEVVLIFGHDPCKSPGASHLWRGS